MQIRLLMPVLATAAVAMLGVGASAQAVYQDPKAPLQARVNDVFGRMTQDEKLEFLEGGSDQYSTVAIPRLGIPSMEMVDAGEGVRGGSTGTMGPATLMPSEVILAGSWDPDLVAQCAKAIGVEAQNKGIGAEVLLGPDINMHRGPLGGRDGESFSEDPYLNARMAVAYVQGMQCSGTAACIKHFAGNNEESDRNFVDVNVDPRALHEIYLPAFKAGVQEGHVWTVMDAYNKVNGAYCTANTVLNDDILKKTWGFDGVVMSDWSAVHDTVAGINGGCDLEMPGGAYYTPKKLAAALAAGQITQAEIDDSVKRILRTEFRVGLFDHPVNPDPTLVSSAEHRQLTYTAATEGIVLLKNDGILPLDPSSLHSIALIGPAAASIQAGASGSPSVTPDYQVQPIEGIKSRLPAGVTVNYAEGLELPAGIPGPVPAGDTTPSTGGAGEHGLTGEYYTTADLSGTPTATHTETSTQFGFRNAEPALPAGTQLRSARWSGNVTAPYAGVYTFVVITGAATRLYLNDKPVESSDPSNVTYFHSAQLALSAGQTVKVRAEITNIDTSRPFRGGFGWIMPERDFFDQAAAAAKSSDVAVVFVTTRGTDGENRDRPSLQLPGNQDALIEAVAAANKNTVVVLNSGTPVQVTGWLKSVKGLLYVGFPGEDAGNAIADILVGKVNPSGKLTDTFGARREDYPDYGNFPGGGGEEKYAEGIYVGYRHFDKAGIRPIFPFGYGLSYTTFRYSHVQVDNAHLATDGTVTVSADITNTGKRAGSEVAQLYVHDTAPKIDKPVRELKGFARVTLDPGQTKSVTFTLTPQDLAYYNVNGNVWQADPGSYELQIGASSRDIRLKTRITLDTQYQKAD